MANIIYSEEFGANLEGWLFANDQKYATWFYRNKQAFPLIFRKPPDKLYRGMIVDTSFFEEIDRTGYVTFKTHTSWSKDKDTAIKFAKDKRFKLAKKDGIEILIEKKITPTSTLLDIESTVNFLGDSLLLTLGVDELSIDSAKKEFEVLVSKGVKIRQKDIKLLS